MTTKRIHRKTYKQEEYLPVNLVIRLNDIFSSNRYQSTTRNNFLQCVSIIYYHQVTNGIGLNDYVPLGSAYWKQIYGGNYHESVIIPLLTYRIIETLDFGSRNYPNVNNPKVFGKQVGSVVTRYRINPELLCNKFDIIRYVGNGKIMTGLDWLLSDKQEFVEPLIPDFNFHITIDKEKACKWVDDNAERICNDFLNHDYIQSLPERLLIGYRFYNEKGSYDVEYRSVAYAKMFAETKGLKLFYYNDTFYIANIDEFLKQRLPALAYHYKQQICLIGNIPIEEKRSKVTLRLYSHLTNFPSKILQFININGRTMVQLDLRTSQFLIFANLLNTYISHGKDHLISLFKQDRNITYLKHLIKILEQHEKQLPTVGVDINDSKSGAYSSSDVTKFNRDVFFTDFYDTVKNALGLQERMLAKTLLFKLLFKKTNRKDELLDRLTERYPIVMSIIAGFKKPEARRKAKDKDDDDRQSNFSVFLQCIEAEIFVDNILNQLRIEGIACFSRHDSLIIASGDEEQAEKIVKSIFNRFGFRYNYKKEDLFWDVVDYEEFEDSGYLDWLADEDILNADYSVEYNIDDPLCNEAINSEDMDGSEITVMDKLRNIGIQDSYFEYIDAEFLEEISQLPFLTKNQRDICNR